MEEAKANVGGDKHEDGFRRIAWAFLKVHYSAIIVQKHIITFNLLFFSLFFYFSFLAYWYKWRTERQQ